VYMMWTQKHTVHKLQPLGRPSIKNI
jgi:hypothetical protein